jgi:hypothetical protein
MLGQSSLLPVDGNDETKSRLLTTARSRGGALRGAAAAAEKDQEPS